MTTISNTTYTDLEVGSTAHYSKTINEQEVQLFAALSGDRNPVHLDEAFAAKTAFKGRIAHGMLTGALISAAVANTLPGPGTIYLGQQITFSRPARLGDTLTVNLEILEKLPKFRVRIRTQVVNQQGEELVDGVAEVLAPRKPATVTLTELPQLHIG